MKKHCRIQKELNKELGKDVKRDYPHDEEDKENSGGRIPRLRLRQVLRSRQVREA